MLTLALAATFGLLPAQPVEPSPEPAPATVSVEHIEARDNVLVTAALVLVFAGGFLIAVKL